MNTNQQTLTKEAIIEGTGLHTGKKVVMKLCPAEENTGVVFRRVDLNPSVDIPALASYVHDTSRGTTLKHNDSLVYTVEHVMAALAGMEVDNCIVEINNEEIPIMDGSSAPFVKAIKEAGISPQSAERVIFEVKEIIRFSDENGGSEIICLPADELKITVLVDYETEVLGTQNAVMDSIKDFESQISESRTFSFLHELEYLLDKGLIKGGDIKNAIIYVDKQIDEVTIKKLQEVFDQPAVEVKPNGILNNIELKHPNEAARHKLLDVLGDISLAGSPIRGHIIATKPGHKANTEFAKELLSVIKQSRKNEAPKYDPSAEPLMDIVQIMNMLPHRPPFLLVDKILELSGAHVVGLKNVTMNESFFNGHFPGAPVMPGVLQVEAMAQVGGILALSTVPDPENYLTYFLRLDNVKFKSKVLPGDTLIFKLQLTAPIRRGLVQMSGEAYVGNKVVMQAEMMAQIKKEKNIEE
ncbi:MAG: bifunctional UDP-3-O-[3-hydroxymyristoyl] N-acetylglucosamine deacetylase/3-hydroxyacyl-ACP dehydratase [Cryomorphaceae bacterium]|nr:bifunctional UDP-3-O-[3-hydroxymyristoyl] N-acetylglucosamine deacetylase/3-hydroxyacyl-ACP dehydratase [Cryomorphaceae bacterium]